MPRERDEWPSRIKSIEREYGSVRLAVDRLLSQVRFDPTILNSGIALRDIVYAAENLEGTYFVRLFAEFETGVRNYWKTFRDTHPRMEDLVNSLASRHKIPFNLTVSVHIVRNLRNSLVHEREDVTETVTIGEARKYLCKYLARLPSDWD
jgi:hypothetical protein